MNYTHVEYDWSFSIVDINDKWTTLKVGVRNCKKPSGIYHYSNEFPNIRVHHHMGVKLLLRSYFKPYGTEPQDEVDFLNAFVDWYNETLVSSKDPYTYEYCRPKDCWVIGVREEVVKWRTED